MQFFLEPRLTNVKRTHWFQMRRVHQIVACLGVLLKPGAGGGGRWGGALRAKGGARRKGGMTLQVTTGGSPVKGRVVPDDINEKQQAQAALLSRHVGLLDQSGKFFRCVAGKRRARAVRVPDTKRHRGASWARHAPALSWSLPNRSVFRHS